VLAAIEDEGVIDGDEGVEDEGAHAARPHERDERLAEEAGEVVVVSPGREDTRDDVGEAEGIAAVVRADNAHVVAAAEGAGEHAVADVATLGAAGKDDVRHVRMRVGRRAYGGL